MEMNENLEKTFTRMEVEDALFQMGPLKSSAQWFWGLLLSRILEYNWG